MIFYIIVGTLGVLYFVVRRLVSYYEHPDLASSNLGLPNPRKPFKNVIVLGGSISGLLTAKCLSNHAEKVILVERSRMELNNKIDWQSSVAKHGSFVHILLTRGCDIMCRLFPGLEDDLSQNPHVFPVDFGCDVYWRSEGSRLITLPPGDVGFVMKQVQRFILENLLRDRLHQTRNVEIRDETKFVSYTMNSSSHITGITCSKDNNEVSISADLVVDCMGLLSPTSSILAKEGITIESAKVRADLEYVSQLYQQPEGVSHKIVYYQPRAPDDNIGMVLIPYTKGVSVATFVGYNRAKLPRKQNEVNEVLKQFPEVGHYLAKCTPITETTSYKKEGTELRHFEKVHLDGLIALGDSFCNFNPVFGQGQTSAAEQVLALDIMLRDLQPGQRLDCNKFQQRALAMVTIPFALAAFSDLRFSKTVTNAPKLKFIAPVIAIPLKKLLVNASKNQHTYKCFTRVLHMRQGYIWTFLNPKLLWDIFTQ